MKIYLGTDHAGFELKEEVKKFLELAGHDVTDMGALTYDKLDDYPDFIIPAAEAVGKDPENSRGIVFGGSGQGEAIAANKVKGVRAALFYGHNLDIVELSRSHNNSNVLSLGARMMETDMAKEAIALWLKTPFEGDRHQRRIDKISQFEGKLG